MKDVRSFCRICGAVCGLVVTLDGPRVVRVRGDRDHPLSRGYVCPKGRAVASMHDDPTRLDHPQIRNAAGDLSRCSWDESLDDLAARLDAIRTESGADAIATYIATGSTHDTLGGRFTFRFAQGLGTRSRYSAVSIDSPCKALVSELMTGRTDLLPSLDQRGATLTVLIGSNPVVSHGHYEGYADPVSRLRELAVGGRELWVVDPRRTESARLATRHLQLRPGTDWALLAFTIRSLLEEGGADQNYLVERTTGVDELRAAVAPIDLREAARRTGLTPTELTDFVDAIRRHGRVAAQTGTGATMSRHANVTEWLMWALQVVMASYDRPGGMWFNPGFLTGHDRRKVPESAPWSPEPGPGSRTDLPGRMGEYPSAGLVDEIESGNVRALVVLGGNPFNAVPQPDRIARAAARLDVLAVADIYETETTALATHVLPCTGQLERADVTFFLDQFLPEVAAQYSPRIVDPAEERRPAWQVFADLGERLGLPVLPDGVDHRTVTEDELLAPIVDRGRAPFTELREAGVLVDEPATFGWVERSLPDGRWRVAPEPLVAQIVEAVRREDDDALVLIPRRQMRHLNSAMRSLAAPGGRVDEPEVLVHPLDAAAADLSDGDLVRVASRHGSFEARARVTDEVRPGAVSVPHGWSGAAAVGGLTSSDVDCDPLTGMPLQSGVPVALSPRIGGEARA